MRSRLLTNVEHPEVHQTTTVAELKALNRCLKMHDYAYRQNLSPAFVPSLLGKDLYLRAIAARYLRAKAAGSEFDFELDSIDVQGQLQQEREATIIEPDRLAVNNVFKEWVMKVEGDGIDLTQHIALTDDGNPLVEQEFLVDVGWRDLVGQPVLLHGVVDLVVVDTDGSWWPNEHNTAGRPWSISQLQFANQGPLYMAALKAIFPERKFGGVQYNFFYPKKADIQQVYITAAHQAMIWNEAQAAIHLRDTGSITRQPHWGCQDCWFRTVCATELMGEDSTLVREMQFKVDQKTAHHVGGQNG